jgi:hypothetical protein
MVSLPRGSRPTERLLANPKKKRSRTHERCLNGFRVTKVPPISEWTRCWLGVCPAGAACDNWLRTTYGGSTVIAQNSLASSMSVNGIMVASRAGLPLCESHPKLLNKGKHLPDHVVKFRTVSDDHAFDALVAAWCANRWHSGHWKRDLYKMEDDMVFPAGPAVYPWLDN